MKITVKLNKMNNSCPHLAKSSWPKNVQWHHKIYKSTLDPYLVWFFRILNLKYWIPEIHFNGIFSPIISSITVSTLSWISINRLAFHFLYSWIENYYCGIYPVSTASQSHPGKIIKNAAKIGISSTLSNILTGLHFYWNYFERTQRNVDKYENEIANLKTNKNVRRITIQYAVQHYRFEMLSPIILITQTLSELSASAMI